MKMISLVVFTALTFALLIPEMGVGQVSSSPPVPAPSATPGPVASPAVVPTSAVSPEASPAPAAVVVEEPTFLEKVWAFLQTAGGFIAGGVVVFEIALRAFPTKNPHSILVPVKKAVDTLILIFTWLSNSVLIPLINAANKSREKIEPKR